MQVKSLKNTQEYLLKNFTECRQLTLNLCANLDRETFIKQAHPDFSPIGWHLGHIAFTESYWILEKCANLPPLFPQYHQLFAADGLPKSERENLPELETILDYLTIVRKQVFKYLETAPLETQEKLWNWLLQHESQHGETITLIQQLHRLNKQKITQLNSNKQSEIILKNEPILIPAGEFILGNNNLEAIDNESPENLVYLDDFYLDKYPIMCYEYMEFMENEGYQKREFWSEEGWQWLTKNPVSKPLYWQNSPEFNYHPVSGVNYYEAEAYCNFIGKRLPTEMEWEKAASWDNFTQKKHIFTNNCNHNLLVGNTTPVNTYSEGKSPYGCYDMLGNVWEWTNSYFAGYNGFKYYLYPGYSQVYFDHKHRVLRGGSYATRSWALRTTFRNWYHPWVRQIFAGFRCANDLY
jgi:gamma-glutamyl hercynylcysteine S-oxide synthase